MPQDRFMIRGRVHIQVAYLLDRTVSKRVNMRDRTRSIVETSQ
jgi:hypothetical protein